MTASSGQRLPRDRPNTIATLRVPLHTRSARSARPDSSSRRPRFPVHVIPDSTDTRVLGVHFNAFDVRPVRIVFDVCPLSHPAHRSRQLHPRLTRGLCSRRPRAQHEIVAFGPTSLRGPGRIRSALDGLDVESACWAAAGVACAADRLEHRRGRPVGGAVSRAGSTSLHFSDWMYPPQRGGVRSTMIHDLVPVRFPDWTTKRTRAMHGAQVCECSAHCDVVFVNSAYTGRDVTELLGVAAERVSVAHPVSSRASREGAARGPRSPVCPHGRDARAAQEPRRHSPRRAGLIDGELLLAVAGGEGWGDQPVLDDPRVVRLGFVSDEELATALPRRRCCRLPLTFRGLRDADRRGDGLRHPRRRLVPRVDGRRVRRRRRARGSRRSRCDRRRDRACDRPSASELRAAGLEHAARFTWRGRGEVILRRARTAA